MLRGEEKKADLSVLKGLSNENIEEALFELKSYEEAFKTIPSVFPAHMDRPFFGLDLQMPANSSVLFCLESLLFQIVAPYRTGSIYVNPLCSCDDREAFNRLYQQGHKTFKFKINKEPLEKETSFLKSLPGDIKLRLDANQGLEKIQLTRLHANLKLLDIDYFEEPLKTLQDYNKLDIPFALDENRLEWIKFKGNKQLRAVVTKPSTELSLSGCFQLAQELSKFGIPLVVSSSFDTPVALKTLAAFAHLLDKHYGKSVHGLDGLHYFQKINTSGLAIRHEKLCFDLS